MYKSIALVVFSVLMGIAVIVGMSTNISGKLIQVFNVNKAATHLSAGVNAELVESQNSSSALGGIETQSDFFLQSESDRPHGCHADSSYNPLDD